MGKTISLELPEETLERYRQGAVAAHKMLEAFLVDRLEEAVPPVAGELPSPLREELTVLETLDDDDLQKVANSDLLPDQQRQYDDLLSKNGRGTITPRETETLRTLGEEARQLTLKKSHAYMLLKWRGCPVPSREDLLQTE